MSSDFKCCRICKNLYIKGFSRRFCSNTCEFIDCMNKQKKLELGRQWEVERNRLRRQTSEFKEKQWAYHRTPEFRKKQRERWHRRKYGKLAELSELIEQVKSASSKKEN